MKSYKEIKKFQFNWITELVGIENATKFYELREKLRIDSNQDMINTQDVDTANWIMSDAFKPGD